MVKNRSKIGPKSILDRLGGQAPKVAPGTYFFEASRQPSWRVLGPKMALVTAKLMGLGVPNGAKMVKKPISKSILCFWMPIRIDVLSDFDRFGCQNGAKLAPKWDLKSMLFSKGVFSKKIIFPNEKSRFLRSKGWKLGAKTDQKSIKKGSQHGKASWHRFLNDFGGFGEAS